jgi:3-methyladenine DNA glycosylase AlkD
MILLTYYFGVNEDEFEYEPDMLDVADYFEKNLSNEEIAKYVKEWFEELPKEDQHDLLKSFEEPNFACPNFLHWVEEDKNWCVTDVLMDESMLELFEDELHDYFEDDAFDMWEDSRQYGNDPYSYNGVSPSDFY